jgi:hypothetical protein
MVYDRLHEIAAGAGKTLDVSTYSRQVHPRSLKLGDTSRSTLPQRKDLVPIAIGKSILSAASTILLLVRVNPWSIVRNRSLSGLPFSQDTMKNKEDFRDLIDQCNKIGELINRTIWEISEEQISPMLDEALENLAR